MLTELQRADVGDYGPAILGRNLFAIAWHRAEAVRYDVIEVSDRRRTKAIDVIRRRLAKASLNNHASAVADPAVADRTINVESILTTVKHSRRDRKGKFSHV